MRILLVALCGVTFLGKRLTAANRLGILLLAARAFLVPFGRAAMSGAPARRHPLLLLGPTNSEHR
jgi:hypothetical protein